MRTIRIRTRGRFAVLFVIVHLLSVLVAIAYILCAALASQSDPEPIGDFQFNLAGDLIVAFYVTGTVALITSIIGFISQAINNNPCLFVLYCVMLGVQMVMELSVGTNALDRGISTRRTSKDNLLNGLLSLYCDHESHGSHQHKCSSVVHQWDRIQNKFNCCGVSDYKDWQMVQYGRTSLRVPTSCCLPSYRKDKYCGLNMLPFRRDASRYIYDQGCLGHLVQGIEVYLYVMGIFALVVSLLHLILVVFAGYMIITKRL